MANITGTNGKDTLKGTVGDDIIKGLNGNDIIIASDGNDTIDGGVGNDTADYSNLPNDIATDIDSNGSLQVAHFVNPNSDGTLFFKDTLTNIETIIGNAQERNSVNGGQALSVDIDLSQNRFTYSLPTGSKTITVKNFSNVSGSAGKDRIKGNDLNNNISGGPGNDVIIGSKGNDTIFGYRTGFGPNSTTFKQTLDYSNIGSTIKLMVSEFKIDKGGLGVDSVVVAPFQKVIGVANKNNTIDASNFAEDRKFDVNLTTNLLTQYFDAVPIFNQLAYTQKLEVVNFVNVIGSKFNDKIVGGNKNSQLSGGGGNDIITGGNGNDIITGGSGNDTINGGNGNDRITGTDSTARGNYEVDILTGGGGRDKFVLGDKNGAYYVANGNDDYAKITDFDLFQDSISIGSLKNYSFALAGNNSIDLYSGKDVKTRDLIAKIQIAGGISSVASNAKSAMSPDASLNALIGKINIIST
jgi:Ca2+-binding RTX toxin-like protein